jgi:hypothetical protein
LTADFSKFFRRRQGLIDDPVEMTVLASGIAAVGDFTGNRKRSLPIIIP